MRMIPSPSPTHFFAGESQPSAKHAALLGPLLYLAPQVCWPPSSGAQLRNFYLARHLALGAHLTYLSFAESTPAATPESDKRGQVLTVPRDRGYTPLKLLRGVLGRTPLPVLNYSSRSMAQVLEKLLKENDFAVVQVQGLHLADYLPIIRAARSKPLVVCDWHNVESELMQRYAERVSNPLRRIYARATARKMAAMERRILGEFDAHLVVSERDRLRLQTIAPQSRIFVIENGVNVEYFTDDAPPEEALRRRIVFTGLMDYHANVDAAVHFARAVWPGVYAQRPDLTFTLVGRNPIAQVQALAELPGVEVTGQVPDVRPYFREAIAAIVPLRIGGGSRLKILEAMASGVPVVSTRLGAEGLTARDREQILLADTDDDLRCALLEVAGDEYLRRKLVASARSLVAAHYDWPVIGNTLLDIYRQLLQPSA
jgi:sugar transferase (PEP-CTERM/EpsH1 system associated)